MKLALFISISVFISIVLLFLGMSSYIRHRKDRQNFQKKVEQFGEGLPLEETVKTAPGPRNVIKEHLLNIFKYVGTRVIPKNEGEFSQLRKSFLRAGYRGGNTPIIFFGVKAFLAVLLALGFSLLKIFLMITIPPLRIMLFSVLLALIGFYLPNIWLKSKIGSRKQEILSGFPDALDLMVVCVEAGMGLDSAINRVGEEMKLSNRVLSDEFKLMSLELRMGVSRRDTLRNLALRTDLEDVSSLVTLLIQTDKFGTSVAQALRVHSDSMRIKRHQRAEEVAAKLPVKLLFPLIFFIFPSLFVVILGPAVINIVRILFPAFGGK